MADTIKLSTGTGVLYATNDDPRTSWEFAALPPSQRKAGSAPKKKNLLRIFLNALRLP